ncbi:MAG TPA: hypothetical protein DCG51_08325 [Erysipelotrichaceae bacterium]|nr:hypothetical protein [Erysipelotrichaceae bacterium]
MNIQDYVTVTVMAAVWLIIQILKKPVFDRCKLSDYIPLFAAVLGILFVFWINGAMDFTLFLEGIASGFSATGLNEGINAVFNGDSDAE